MNRFLLTVLSTIAVFLAVPAFGAEHTKDSLPTVMKRVTEKKAILLDVREKREWDAGHLKDARLMPLSDLRNGKVPADLDKKKIIYCHCAAGRRALTAADILKKKILRNN